MTTNAQAALQAAATIFGESGRETSVQTVQGMAAQFKRWLDAKDKEATEAPGEVHVDIMPTLPDSFRYSNGVFSDPLRTSLTEHLYEVDMKPRNLATVPAITLEVWAISPEEAISKALSMKPGHVWSKPRRGQVSPPVVPKPGPRATTEQQWLGNSEHWLGNSKQQP